MTNSFWLSALTLIPVATGVLVLWLGRRRATLGRALAFLGTLGVLLLTLLICIRFDGSQSTLQFVENRSWVPALEVDYFLGIDGLGLVMLLLTAIVMPMVLGSGKTPGDRPHLYYALLLFLQAGLIGTFTALNFFHWFLFWELSLIPTFFLIRLWGDSERATTSTLFFVYTLVGSVALLLGFLALYQTTQTFDFIRLAELGRNGIWQQNVSESIGWSGWSNESLAMLIFLGVLLGFAVKVPLMPFHTWLPSTYTSAPTPVTMVLTGLMSKMGLYGMLRILVPIFPEQLRAASTVLVILAVITIVFSAASALAQRDLKRVFAYSSINHLGYALLAIFAVFAAAPGAVPNLERIAALNGVVLQIFNHGITAACLFCFVGFIEARTSGSRGLDDFGGLRRVVPVFTGLMGISLFSSLGLPGLNSFVGEFLIFKGTFALSPWAAALAVPGLLMTAWFLLNIIQKVFSGPLNERWKAFPELTMRERWLVGPIIGLMFWVGIWPQSWVGLFNATVTQWVNLGAF